MFFVQLFLMKIELVIKFTFNIFHVMIENENDMIVKVNTEVTMMPKEIERKGGIAM